MSATGNDTSSGSNASNASESHGPVVTAVTAWMVACSSLCIILRCISRLGIIRRWGLDDTFIIIAWLLALGFSFAILWAVRMGFGLHDSFISEENQLPLRKSEYAFSVLYNPVLMATKTSILLFYLTLSKTQKIFWWSSIATLTVVNAAGVALTFANCFQCTPAWGEFQEPIPSYTICTDLVTLYLSSAPVNICTDLAILVLPMPILTNMRLPRKQKIILVITFSFGAFVAAVDVVRIAYLEQAFQVRINEVGAENATASRVTIQDDFSWYASLSFMWSAIEVHVGILCACVPSLKPLVARIIPSMLRDTSDPHDVSGSQHPNHSVTAINAIDFGALGRPTPHRAISPRASPRQTALEDQQDLDTESNIFQNNEDLYVDGSANHQHAEATGREVDMLEFLTTPDMNTSPRPNGRASLALTATATSGATNFDFYNMASRKPLTKLTNKESIIPVALVTTLFFLWGCAYGFLNILNSQFALVAGFTNGQTVGTHAAYYGGYAIGPFFPGRIVLKKIGFKATFITGLSIYALGILVFWPSAVLVSFPAFIISNLIVGIGVSVLEVGANPFVALCGPPAHSETRLNISQGVQAIGTVVAPLLAQRVLFKDVTSAAALIDVQWTYLGISLFAVALAVAFLYLPINEASDEDFEQVAEKRQSINSATLGKMKVIHVTLALGVFAQFCYVGAQESAAVRYTDYISSVDLGSNPQGIDTFSWLTVGHTLFAVGRFLCAGLQIFIKPRRILLFLYIGMVVTSILCMSLTGSSAIAVLTLYELFQSGIFSLIYAISLRGLGSYTITGAVFLTAAISGGAIFPVIMNTVADRSGLPYSFCVVVAASAGGIVFPIYLETVGKAKRQVDPVSIVKPSLPTNERRSSVMERVLKFIGEKRNSRSGGSQGSGETEHVEESKAVEKGHPPDVG